MSTFFELDCGGETVTLEKTDDGDIIFHGWDEETELAAIELGFEPSDCFALWSAINEDSLDEVLRQQCELGDVAAVVALLFVGASADAKDHDGWAPLHYAAAYGNEDVVKLLLEAGASVNAQDLGGWSPLHYAAQNGNTDIAKILISAKASIDANNHGNRTPLHIATLNCKTDAIEILLRSGANVFAYTSNGKTPLRYAKESGCVNVVEIIESWIAEHGE